MQFKNSNSHLFALYFNGTSSLLVARGKKVVIEDTELHHRIAHVLRFNAGSQCLFFDKEHYVDILIEKIQKKSFEITIVAVYKNQPLSPDILLLLPVLKRQALSEAVYAAIETGVSALQLVETDKVQRAWGGQKELERLQAVIIAACEQAKYFSVPEIKAPIPLQQAVSLLEDSRTRIYYDAVGAPLNALSADALHKHMAVLVGPEGDLTSDEKEMLKQNSFVFTRLTPTILRSPQAVAVEVGMVRALQ